jgi:GNAT superfamily N-acetyltransferase
LAGWLTGGYFPDSIHNLGLVGHIEDIAVAKDQQGKKLGLRIIEALDHVAERVGCYKVRYGPLAGKNKGRKCTAENRRIW